MLAHKEKKERTARERERERKNFDNERANKA
jgi:hypothetical protein